MAIGGWTDAERILLHCHAYLLPRDTSCDTVPAGGRSNRTCANATGTALPPGDRTRCPHWGDTRAPRDRSWGEIAAYFARVALWYTRGGFVDERGARHESNHRYDETRVVLLLGAIS